MEKEKYPKKIYAQSNVNGDYSLGFWTDYDGDAEDVEYTRSDLIPNFQDVSNEIFDILNEYLPNRVSEDLSYKITQLIFGNKED